MSDKSFGDHTNKNIVKNPLLSSAVTGLSLEDLTHKAVLLPVTPSLDQITRSDLQQGSQAHALAHPKHDTHVFPSGDAFSNITLSKSPQTIDQNILASKKDVNLEENPNFKPATQSKVSVKSDDDFDVNEYIARLQGSRYVSAPLHSHLKEDQKTNLEATEENLEEINLNETIPAETQQSLTADIAQNFSQLPTVLPHVASAVFSSFSNMLNYKGREQTPDRPNVKEADQIKSGYDEVQFQRPPDVEVPLMGFEEYKAPKEVAPPPKEPPIGGTSNYRITSKKKYAQIPGLSSGDAQNMTYLPGHNIPMNMPPTGPAMPPLSQPIPPLGQPMPTLGQNMLSMPQNFSPLRPSYTQNVQHNVMGQNTSELAPNSVSQSMTNIGQMTQPGAHFDQSRPPYAQNVIVLDPSKVQLDEEHNKVAEAAKVYEGDDKTPDVSVTQPQYNSSGLASDNRHDSKRISEIQPNLFAKDTHNFFIPVENRENISANQSSAAIIPPPPMFSNLTKTDSQLSSGKSILPPSVARRIAANQPTMKPTASTSSLTENIFVPAPVSNIEQANSGLSSRNPSDFVLAYGSAFKSETPSHMIYPTELNVSSSFPPSNSNTPATYFTPKIEEKPEAVIEPPALFTHIEAPVARTSEVSISDSLSSTSSVLPPNPQFIAFPSSSRSSSDLLASSIMPQKTDVPTRNVSAPMFQCPPQNMPLPTLFTPVQESSCSNVPHPITQMPPTTMSDPQKIVPEPPKATSAVNFRMTKKRPQYYAGPIDGVGTISNNVKPVLAPVIPTAMPVEASNFQGALFTPGQPLLPSADQYSSSNLDQSSVPFDINRTLDSENLHTPFDIAKPQEQEYGTAFNMKQPESYNYAQEYNTPFDVSRDPTDPYNETKQESKGFGIIGSLKSKLSSIDINKIQSTVTTFFDPSYNDAKPVDQPSQDNAPYQPQQQFGRIPQGQSNFDVFVPNVEHNQYSQYGQGAFDYSQSSQYHQTQDPYIRNQEHTQNISNYSTSSYFTNPNYSTEQVFSSNPLYDSTQSSYQTMPSNKPQEKITEIYETFNTQPLNTGNAVLYNPNTQENVVVPSINNQTRFDDTSADKDYVSNTQISHKNTKYFDPNDQSSATKTSTQIHAPQNINQPKEQAVFSPEQASNMTYHNPNAFAQENRQIWDPQQFYDNSASFFQTSNDHQKNTLTSPKENIQGPVLYKPNAFAVETQQIDVQGHQAVIESDNTDKNREAMSDIYKDSQSYCDSALNTTKYNMSSIQTQPAEHSVQLLPSASFFDNIACTNAPQFSMPHETDTKTAVIESKNAKPEKINQHAKYEYSKIPENTIYFSNKHQEDSFSVKDNKTSQINEDERVKERNLIESLSKDNIPVLGVSTAPLFGLSAIIADKSKEISASENEPKKQCNRFFQDNTTASLFGTINPENKIISESQVKTTPLDITSLSINDVKNVLVIEPPQENIGALLKRNASSSKLENLCTEMTQFDHFKHQSNDIPISTYLPKQIIEVIKHDSKEHQDLGNVAGVNVDKDNLELNICEICREVDTPEHEQKHKDSEDLTSQLIENITSRMQLSNPLTVPLPENDAPAVDILQYVQNLDEITHIAEETIEKLQMQSATELLDDRLPKRTSSEIRDYGWVTQETIYPPVVDHRDHDYVSKDHVKPTVEVQDYVSELDTKLAYIDNKLKLDPNTIGFGNNSLLLDNEPVPNNASDEIKAEIRHSHEDIILPRQMSVPTAPLEEDIKVDEPGVIDVHSIEQDAKNDFPVEEEFVIEPATDEYLSTDDDKIEFRERKRSSEDSTSNDTFTNRIEKFKKKADNDDGVEQQEEKPYGSPPMSMASYFDTGNYAVESHYRNSFANMRIPPGFEQEFVKKLSDLGLGGENRTPDLKTVPDTSTQTKPMYTSTYASSHGANENIIGFKKRKKENEEAFARACSESETEANIPVHTEENPALVSAANPISLFPDAISTQLVLSPNAESEAKENITRTNPVPSAEVLDSTLSDTKSASRDVASEDVQSLPDPINFFSASSEEPTPEPTAPESFSRLASYFSMPPAQPEHSKSFFELSESQNHYKHEHKTQDKRHKSFFELRQSQNHYIDDHTKSNVKELIKDLTSPQNIKENIVYKVNYFTVELDNDVSKHTCKAAPINVKIIDDKNTPLGSKRNIDNKKELPKDKLTKQDTKHNDRPEKDKAIKDVLSCKYCHRYMSGINIHSKDFTVKSAVNEPSGTFSNESDMSNRNEGREKSKSSVNFAANFDVEKQAEDSVTVTNEHRGGSEYSPVKHHWYYRVDVEEKSVWRGFSHSDSTALEEAYHSPDLNDNTVVATDGGRYDVNVLSRLRIAVYWNEKPTNVRRCSWFYKGTTDARYVPYTETVAEKLEDEYRHGITTGEWHRKLVLPNNEMVIMHGPSVMVHFLHSGATDAFSTPPTLLGKRLYRNPINIKVARDQDKRIDHLVLLVHGAGEYKRMIYQYQTTSRPRVVRRSFEESEIEESEPSKIDHLLLLCHGVGSACDMRFRSVEEVVEDFRATSLQLLQSHYRNSYDNGIVSRVEVLPISWHEQLHSGETGVDRRLSRVTLDSIPRLRAFTNHTVLDVLFYTSPVFHQTIIDTVCSELNRVYNIFLERNPHFKGEVSLGGHSLGSVILYDLLCNQMPESPLEVVSCRNQKTYVSGASAPDQVAASYPQLAFPPAALYALGSPIAIFECIRGVESLGKDFALPTCKNFFNIFHPYDPIAYRIEPLIHPQLQHVKPSQIPHHKGRKRMHLELKDTMARVGADLKQKLIESLRTTWNKWKASPPTDSQLEKVVEEEMEKEPMCEDNEPANEVQVTEEMLGRLNSGRRVDYVLQEAPLEMINEYLFAMSSHVGYWESEDTMLLMLREMYSSLGVQPDCTVPQQSMTVERNTTLVQDDLYLAKESSEPSTSRGAST